MNLRLSPQAQTDVIDIIAYYKGVSFQAAEAFMSQLDKAIILLTEHPAMAEEVADGIRRFPMRGFPYGIYYSGSMKDDLLILSILHLKQNPETIDERILK